MTNQSKALSDVCLCIVFNHAFPQNIPKLKKLYSSKFSNIKFIMPFFQSDDPDIITVYRGSYSHAAYITDACSDLLKLQCTHYFIIQDDVMLNPCLNEENALGIFKLGKVSGFIGEFLQEAADIAAWGFWPGSLWRSQFPKNLLSGTGVESWEEIKNSLPSYVEAKQKLAKYGIGPVTLVRSQLTDQPMFHNNPFGAGISKEEISRFYGDVLRFITPNGSITLDYPFVTAGPYSDFYVLPRASLKEFSHISGVLSAAGFFTEITIPTALALTVDDIVFKKDAEIELDWVTEARSPEVILDMFVKNPRLMAMHPIKLSRQSDEFIKSIDAIFSKRL